MRTQLELEQLRREVERLEKEIPRVVEHIRRNFPGTRVVDLGYMTLGGLLDMSATYNIPRVEGRSVLGDRLSRDNFGISPYPIIDVRKLYPGIPEHILIPAPSRFASLPPEMVFHVIRMEAATPDECVALLKEIDKVYPYVDYYYDEICGAPSGGLGHEVKEKATEMLVVKKEKTERRKAVREEEEEEEAIKPSVKIHPQKLTDEEFERLWNGEPEFRAFVERITGAKSPDIAYVVLGPVARGLVDWWIEQKSKAAPQPPPPSQLPPQPQPPPQLQQPPSLRDMNIVDIVMEYYEVPEKARSRLEVLWSVLDVIIPALAEMSEAQFRRLMDVLSKLVQ